MVTLFVLHTQASHHEIIIHQTHIIMCQMAELD